MTIVNSIHLAGIVTLVGDPESCVDGHRLYGLSAVRDSAQGDEICPGRRIQHRLHCILRTRLHRGFVVNYLMCKLSNFPRHGYSPALHARQ